MAADLMHGVVTATVINNADPLGQGRVLLSFNHVPPDMPLVSNWARVATPMAGLNAGFFALPPVLSQVLVAFEHGDLREPYVIGALWDGLKIPPLDVQLAQLNTIWKGAMAGPVIQLTGAPGLQQVVISDTSPVAGASISVGGPTHAVAVTGGAVTITALESISLVCGAASITINSAGACTIACTTLSVTTAEAAVTSAGPLALTGALVDLNHGALQVI